MDDNFTAVDTSLVNIQEDLDTLTQEPGEVTSIRYVTGSYSLGSKAYVRSTCRNYGDTEATVSYFVNNSTQGNVHVATMSPYQVYQSSGTSMIQGMLAIIIETDSPDILCWSDFESDDELIARYLPNDYVVYKESNGEWKRTF
jgi:hypothetical protein